MVETLTLTQKDGEVLVRSTISVTAHVMVETEHQGMYWHEGGESVVVSVDKLSPALLQEILHRAAVQKAGRF